MNKFYILIIIFTISCSSNPINGQNLSLHGFYSTPDEIILKFNNKKNTAAEHFLLASAYKKKKKYRKAVFYFVNSSFKKKGIKKIKIYDQSILDYLSQNFKKSIYYYDSVYEISNILFKYNQNENVLKLLQKITSEQKSLYLQSNLLKAFTFSKLKQNNKSLSILKNLHKRYDNDSIKSKINIRIASVYEKTGENENALDLYLKIIKSDLKSWYAAISSNRIIKIFKKHKLNVSNDEVLYVSKALFYSKKYKNSYNFLRKNFKGTMSNNDYKIFFIRLLSRLKKNKLIKILLNKIKKNNVFYFFLLYNRADELWKMRKKGKAVSLYKKIITAGYEPEAQKSLYRVSKFLHDNNRKGRFLYIEKYLKKYPSDKNAGFFLWLLGRWNIKNNKISIARDYLENSIKRFPRGNYSDMCRFWLFKINSKNDNGTIREKIIKDMVTLNPDSAYTAQLLQRYKNMYSVKYLEDKFKISIEKNMKKDILFFHSLLFFNERDFVKRNNRIKKINAQFIKKIKELEGLITLKIFNSKYNDLFKLLERYFIIGNTKAINGEINTLLWTKNSLKYKYAMLVYFGTKYNNYFMSTNNMKKLVKLLGIKENISFFTKLQLKTLYPLSFKDCVNNVSKRFKINKFMIYSVMKAESLFKHYAVSKSGAIGLMQIMPATGRGLARQLKLKKYNLKKPCTSINFGTKYLSWLNKFFKADFKYIVAGYNAGPNYVKKWLRKRNYIDSDYFTEYISFIETKYYILRTEKFFVFYKMIYL